MTRMVDWHQIWDRQRNIPRSASGSGPLEHIFDSFDSDGDGESTLQIACSGPR